MSLWYLALSKLLENSICLISHFIRNYSIIQMIYYIHTFITHIKFNLVQSWVSKSGCHIVTKLSFSLSIENQETSLIANTNFSHFLRIN